MLSGPDRRLRAAARHLAHIVHRRRRLPRSSGLRSGSGASPPPRKPRAGSASADRAALLARLNAEAELPAAAVGKRDPASMAQMRAPGRADLFTVAVFFWNIGFLGFIIWLPSVIHQDASAEPDHNRLAQRACPSPRPSLAMQFLTRLVRPHARPARPSPPGPSLICGAALAGRPP